MQVTPSENMAQRVPGANIGQDIDCPSDRDFIQSLQDIKTVVRSGHWCFLPNPFHLIAHPSSYHKY
jgi:hypothetical protein